MNFVVLQMMRINIQLTSCLNRLMFNFDINAKIKFTYANFLTSIFSLLLIFRSCLEYFEVRVPQNVDCLRNYFFLGLVGLLVKMDVAEGVLLSHMLASYFLFQYMEVLGGKGFHMSATDQFERKNEI